MALGQPHVSGGDYQTAEGEANFRRGAVGEIEEPEGHREKDQIHEDGEFRAALLAIGPARHRIPEKEEAADQTGDAKHVFAGGGTDEHVIAGEKFVLLANVREILDEQNGKWDQQVAKAAKQRTDGLHWMRIGDNDENYQVSAEVPEPPFEGDEGEVRP